MPCPAASVFPARCLQRCMARQSPRVVVARLRMARVAQRDARLDILVRPSPIPASRRTWFLVTLPNVLEIRARATYLLVWESSRTAMARLRARLVSSNAVRAMRLQIPQAIHQCPVRQMGDSQTQPSSASLWHVVIPARNSMLRWRQIVQGRCLVRPVWHIAPVATQ